MTMGFTEPSYLLQRSSTLHNKNHFIFQFYSVQETEPIFSLFRFENHWAYLIKNESCSVCGHISGEADGSLFLLLRIPKTTHLYHTPPSPPLPLKLQPIQPWGMWIHFRLHFWLQWACTTKMSVHVCLKSHFLKLKFPETSKHWPYGKCIHE